MTPAGVPQTERSIPIQGKVEIPQLPDRWLLVLPASFPHQYLDHTRKHPRRTAGGAYAHVQQAFGDLVFLRRDGWGWG
jgi:hypothetical protein